MESISELSLVGGEHTDCLRDLFRLRLQAVCDMRHMPSGMQVVSFLHVAPPLKTLST